MPRSLLIGVSVLALLLLGAPAGSAAAPPRIVYNFSSTRLNPDWAVYDSTHTAQPHARVPRLVSVSHGRLHVATDGKNGSGVCLCRGAANTVAPYGRWAIRARASRDADHGFAIMLWPDGGKWPKAGEIDLAEFPGTKRDTLQTTVHYGASNHQITAFTRGDFTKWHTYAVIWRPTSLTYLLDGHRVMRVTKRVAIPSGPMHVALQAGPDEPNPANTRARLDVDWVKITR